MRHLFLVFTIIASLFLTACNGGSNSSKNELIANAGSDQSATVNDAVTLDGSDSFDADDDTLAFLWEMTSLPTGSAVQLEDDNTATPTFVPDIEGEYTIALTVTDGNHTASDSVKVTATDNKYPGMKFVGSGSFYMGTDYGNADERPIHYVYLDSFFIDATEVTVAQYRECVREGICLPPYKNSSLTRAHYFDNTDYDDYPVLNVTYEDAKKYCEYVGKTLPTEAMWEKAARGDTLYEYPWGNEVESGAANFNNSVGDTTQVKSYSDGVSVYGTYDMAGNVAEWVADYYDADYYSVSPSTNPQGPITGDFYVVRGGRFVSDQFDIRTVARDYFPKQEASDFIGFRCAKSE